MAVLRPCSLSGFLALAVVYALVACSQTRIYARAGVAEEETTAATTGSPRLRWCACLNRHPSIRDTLKRAEYEPDMDGIICV